MAITGIHAALVVEDDTALLATLEQALAEDVEQLHLCRDGSSAREVLQKHTVNLLLLDLVLPDGDAFDVLDLVQQQQPTPRIVAMSGAASAAQAFRLAQLGVHGYLTKPFDLAELRNAIQAAMEQPLDIRPHLRSLVGQRAVHEVEAEVRQTMLQEALARAKGSRRSTARLLQVSRQLVQHMIKKARAKNR